MTELENAMLAVIREYRRLSNLGSKDMRDTAQVHIRADGLLRLQPELDEPNERYDAVHAEAHRKFVANLFARGRR